MTRVPVDVDMVLLRQVMESTGIESQVDAAEYALRELIQCSGRKPHTQEERASGSGVDTQELPEPLRIDQSE